ncbi:MAG: DUF389 domain-containing protein [Ilumatobacteraceae bacterium]
MVAATGATISPETRASRERPEGPSHVLARATIPAIAAIGVGIALQDWDDMRGAAAQLGANLACLVIVGALTFAVLRRWPQRWRRPHTPI